MNGIQTDSARTPKASRAGALHRYSTLRHSTLRNGLIQDQVDNLTVGAALLALDRTER